jgi:DNA-binding beta-propeller fold protein YncE
VKKTITFLFSRLLFSLLLATVSAVPVFAQTSVGQISKPNLRPQAVAAHEDGNHVFIADDTTGNLYRFDASTNTELDFVQVGKKVSAIVVDEISCNVYVASHADRKISIIGGNQGTLSLVLARTYSNFPSLALDPGLRKVYALSAEGLVQIDINNNSETSIPGFLGGIQALAVNTTTHEVFVTRFDSNVLGIVNGTTLATTFIDGLGGLGIGVNTTENKVYISTGSGVGTPFKVLDRDTGVITSVFAGNDATKFVFNSVSNRMYTDSEINARSTVIEGSDSFFNRGMAGSTLALGVRNSTNHVYYAGLNFMGILDDATQQLELTPISNPTPSSIVVQGVAINQTTGRVYLIHDGNALNFVTVLQDSAPPPALEISLNQSNYVNGDTVSAIEFRFKNLNVLSQKVEIKVWLKIPELAPVPMLNLGSDGTFLLQSGLNTNLGPLPLFQINSSTPRGPYEYGARMNDPVTGELFSQDLNSFSVSDSLAAGALQVNGSSEEQATSRVHSAVLGSLAPIFRIDLNQTSYVLGETVTASQFRLENPTSVAAAVEIKIWLKMPGMTASSILNLGVDGSLALPAGFDQNLGPLSLFVVNASMPLGFYEFSSRIVDPVTGLLISEDENTFEVKPSLPTAPSR